MQLPRGTFRSIRKGVNFSEFLADMASSRFTGTCTISSTTVNGTLVFRSGVCVLAKIQDHYGNGGWAEVTANPNLVIDLAVSDFNTAQIQLALDFNKKARVTIPTTPVQQKTEYPAASASKSVSREPGRQTTHARRDERKRELPTSPVQSPDEIPENIPPTEAPHIHRDDHAILPEQTGQKSLGKDVAQESPQKTSGEVSGSQEESDLDMFDSMDLDDVALKIRKDCKIILKQLQLDHLTEK